MPEAEVLYSDVKFKKGKGAVKEAISSSADTTYSEVKISKTQRSTAEQPESVSSSADATYSEVRISQTQRSTAEKPEVPPQAVVSKRSKVTSERVALLVLSVLLAAALSALCVITFDKMKMKNELKNLEDQRMTCQNNLTETLSKVKACSTVQPTCPTPEVKDEPCYRCEAGWEHHGGKCYHFSISKSSWTQSRADCRAEGGDLVKIDSREEQRFLHERLRDLMSEAEDKFWIGLTDSAAEGRWMWVDNTPLTESLKFWSKGEPDNWRWTKGEHPDGEDCVRMGEKGGAEDLKCWFDAFCSDPYRSVCEKAGELSSISAAGRRGIPNAGFRWPEPNPGFSPFGAMGINRAGQVPAARDVTSDTKTQRPVSSLLGVSRSSLGQGPHRFSERNVTKVKQVPVF